MRTPSFRAIAILFLFIVQPQQMFAQLNEPHIVRDTVNDCLNVRPLPDTSTQPLSCLSPGTNVTVIDTVPFWREIIFGDNKQGWAAKKFLEPVETPSDTTSSGEIPADAILTFHFIDVGQGDAILIQTHDDGIDGNGQFEGYNIIIDGGPYSSNTDNPILSYVEDLGHHGADIKALIITHPHTDHFRGAEAVSRHFDIEHYYDPGYPSTLVSYNAFLNAIRGMSGKPLRAKNIHIGKENFGTLDWGNEIKAEVLYSWDEDLTGLGSGNTEVNNSSIVLRIEYGDHVFLLMGDAEGKDRKDDSDLARYVEKILLDTQADKLTATVLKLGHHGSETSSTIPFIRAVNPSVVVVQSGRKSFSGTFIPDSTTLKRYCDQNSDIRIYRTDQNDESDNLSNRDAVDNDHIVIRTNGSGELDIEALEGGEPFQVDSCIH